MIFQQIQHTTLLLHFAGKTLLIDPVLNSGAQTSLSVPMREILQADAVIITSTHPEHFDETAKNVLPKSIPVFVPDVMALESLKSAGFTNITIMEKETPLDNIAFSRTPLSGNPAGVLIEHPSEKTLFVTGDSVWNDGFLDAVHTLQPRAIAINFGISSAQNAAAFGKESLSKIHTAYPKATLITCHTDAFRKCGLTQEVLRQFAMEHDLTKKFLIPEDGRDYYL